MLIQAMQERNESSVASRKQENVKCPPDKIECYKLKATALGANRNLTDPRYARCATRKKR